MAQLYGNINWYLNTLVAKIIQDDTLCKFLYYDTNCNVLSQPNLTQEQKNSLINSKIFVNKRVPLTQTTAQSLLLIRLTSIEYEDSKTTSIDKLRIDFYIICNREIVDTQNGARDICISTALDNLLLNDKEGDVGIGQLKRWRVQDLTDLGTEFQGYDNVYQVRDINPRITGKLYGNN